MLAPSFSRWRKSVAEPKRDEWKHGAFITDGFVAVIAVDCIDFDSSVE